MKLTHKDTLFATSSNYRSLDHIIQDIKNGVFKDLVCKIRSAEQIGKRTKLQEELPIFFIGVVLDVSAPSVSKSKSVSSTGIIQFDLDEYDLDKSKATIKLST